MLSSVISYPEAAKFLVENGADGVGRNSRFSLARLTLFSSVGFPQFSAVLEVAAAIKGSGVPVMLMVEFGIPVISQKQLLLALIV
jgi:hypothetical protein